MNGRVGAMVMIAIVVAGMRLAVSPARNPLAVGGKYEPPSFQKRLLTAKRVAMRLANRPVTRNRAPQMKLTHW